MNAQGKTSRLRGLLEDSGLMSQEVFMMQFLLLAMGIGGILTGIGIGLVLSKML